MEYNVFREKLHTALFHIYGTGIVGVSIYIALKELYSMIPVSFLVTSREGNQTRIEQIPVQEVAGVSLNENLILVAAPVEHHSAIGQTLHSLGVTESQIIYVGSMLENRIMGEYYASLPDFETAGDILRRFNKTGEEPECGIAHCNRDIKIYQAKCHVDRLLTQEVSSADCIYPIQVGAALTEQSVADLKDNIGDNISRKNRDYCELTATYYAWKNSDSAYKGLCHYRRVFALTGVELEMLFENNAADVILPYPTIHLPDIHRQHSRYVSEPEWQAMRRAVIECEPAYAKEFEQIFSGRYFYNFNMLVARADIFDDYARWLFGILERTEKIIADEKISTTKRYVGYLGENLTTLYFRKNKGNFRLLHAGRVQML